MLLLVRHSLIAVSQTAGDIEMPTAAVRKLERGINLSNIFDADVNRDRHQVDRFAESEYSTFSEFDLSRLDVCHSRVTAADIDEARTTESMLSQDLEAVFAQLLRAISDPTDSDPASELTGEMERAAATTLHAALLECLRASGIDEETSHTWADDASSTLTVPACMPDWRAPSEEGGWGQLVITPSSLKWIPPTEVTVEGADCMACEEAMQWLLTSFAGTGDDADEATAC